MNEMFQLEGTTLRIILPQELDHPMAESNPERNRNDCREDLYPYNCV